MLNEMSPYILLGFFIAGLMHAFVSKRTFARHLSGTGWKAVVKSALIGVPLPLCSCGVLPTAVAMKRNGASKAATTSFLVATPQTGVDSIAATWSLLGPAFAVVRPVAALVTAVFGGVAVGKSESKEQAGQESDRVILDEEHFDGVKARIVGALKYGFIDLVSSIGGWLVVGLIVAALITVYVPTDFFAILGSTPILAMMVVLLIAIPMYVCATGSIPIAMSLIVKGLSPGTALVLLMAGPAANFASFTLISREMGRRAAIIYLLSIIIGAVLFGMAIDYLLPAEWFRIDAFAHGHHHLQSFSLFSTICSAVLVSLLLYSLFKRFVSSHNINYNNMTEEYIIKGMNCPHCQATVTKAIGNVAGVTQVEVNLSSGRAVVDGDHRREEIISAVRNAGFDVVE